MDWAVSPLQTDNGVGIADRRPRARQARPKPPDAPIEAQIAAAELASVPALLPPVAPGLPPDLLVGAKLIAQSLAADGRLSLLPLSPAWAPPPSTLRLRDTTI